jgi:GAF domain-containing protein
MSQRRGFRAFIPIHAEDDLIGFMGCGSGEGRALHPEDLTLMQMIADHLAGILGANVPARQDGASWRTPGVVPSQNERTQ